MIRPIDPQHTIEGVAVAVDEHRRAATIYTQAVANRRHAIVLAHQAGIPADVIADITGMSRRRIYQLLQPPVKD